MPQQRILVVEDDEKLAELIKRVLEGVGHQVKTVGSGAMAIQEAAATRPDLVILDLNLPDTNGYHVCRLLRTLYHPSVMPVLMFTGLTQPIDQLRGFAHGADAYLTKPCELHELVGTVSTLLERAGQRAFGDETPLD